MSQEELSKQDIFTARDLQLSFRESHINKTYSLSEYKQRFPQVFALNKEEVEPLEEKTILKRLIEKEIGLEKQIGFLPSDDDIEEAFNEDYVADDEKIVRTMVEGLMGVSREERYGMLLALKFHDDQDLSELLKRKIFKQVGEDFDTFGLV